MLTGVEILGNTVKRVQYKKNQERGRNNERKSIISQTQCYLDMFKT